MKAANKILREAQFRPFVFLLLIYSMTHWMLIFASGRWWDDWCCYDYDIQRRIDISLQSGRPSAILFVYLDKIGIQSYYRILTFVMFFVCMIFLYSILKNWLSLTDKACFWICALFVTIPANDARIMYVIFLYTWGYFFFFAGWCYVAHYINNEIISFSVRVISYILFLIGFTFNSTLVLYGLVFLMIIMKKGIKNVYKYVDYLILPVLFYILKQVLFPTYLSYDGYNEFTIKSLWNALILLIPADLKILRVLIYNCIDSGGILLLVFCMVFFLIDNLKNIISFCKIKINDILMLNSGENKENYCLIVIGMLALSAGLFPYVVIRQTYDIRTAGPPGRDSMLIALGVSMIYYAFSEIFLKSKLAKCFYVFIIVGGILFFNHQYIVYQWDYYRQLGFQYQLEENREELKELKNLVYLNSDSIFDSFDPIYVLNGNARVVFGDQTRLVLNGFQATKYFTSRKQELEWHVNVENYNMCDYDTSYTRIDAVLDYKFDMTLRDAFKTKLYEMIDRVKFKNKVYNSTKMQVMLYGTPEYEECLSDNGYSNL